MSQGIAIVVFGASSYLVYSAWRQLPEDARFPLAWGVPPSVEGTVSKRTGLALFLLIEASLLAGVLIAAPRQPALGWIGASLMLFQLLAENRLVRRLAGRSYRRAI